MNKHLNRDKEILGIDYSLANQRLHQMILLEILKEDGKNFCHRCKEKIDNYLQLSIEHIENWGKTNDKEMKPELFLNIDNITFSHRKCNSASAKAYTGSSKYVGVRWFFDKRKNYGKWCAYIGKNIGSKFQYFGYHDNEKLAAHARDLGVMKFYNGRALMNFPEYKDLYKEIIEKGWGDYKLGSRTNYKAHYNYFREN